MKKNYLSFLLLAVSSVVYSQIVNIPDPFFKNALVNKMVVDFDGDGMPESDADTNNDGEIQVSEAEAVIYLFPRAEAIVSLEGIESFVNIEILNCSQNALTTLDLSQNLNLRIVSCFFNDLTSLNVSQNVNLVELNCDLNELTEINVTNNPNLEHLWVTYNQLASIDLSQNPNLFNLNTENNNLTTLDLSHNPNLEILSFNNNEITAIDLSFNPNLRILGTYSNRLTALDISQNLHITKLWCNNNELENLNIQNGNNTAFIWFNAENNPSLLCIQVDDEVYANSQPNWKKDDTAFYSENCLLNNEDFTTIKPRVQLYPNPASSILYLRNTSEFVIQSVRVLDVLGRQVLVETDYFDQIDLSRLTKGVLFVDIGFSEGNQIQRIIKE